MEARRNITEPEPLIAPTDGTMKNTPGVGGDSVTAAQDCNATPETNDVLVTIGLAAGSYCSQTLRFGKYELLNEIGRGGMGVVYQARDLSLIRLVALKMLPDGMLHNSAAVERFLREARAAAKLRHRNVTPIHEVEQCDGRYYYTMDLIHGGSLASRLEQGPLDVSWAAATMEKIARAVHAAHQNGIVHRDLKPANILLDSQHHDEPMVSDFGLAKLVEVDDFQGTRNEVASHELTGADEVLGTRSYMSPEQWLGRNDEIGPTTDVWALGVMLFEMLAGRRPFTGANKEEIKQSILQGNPPSLLSLRRDVSRDLDAIVLKCLNNRHGDRYVSAELLADDLHRWLNGDPVTASPPSWRKSLRRWTRRRFGVRTCIGVLGIGGLAATTWRTLSVPRDRLIVAKEGITRALIAGQSVNLVEISGEPRYSRWVDSPSRMVNNRDGSFSIEAFEYAFLELSPPLPIDRFVLTAELKHVNSQQGRAGIFLGHAIHPATEGELHTCLTISFADRGRHSRETKGPDGHFGGAVRTELKLFRKQPAVSSSVAMKVSGFYPPTDPRKPTPWRLLMVSVDRDRALIKLDETVVADVNIADIAKNLQLLQRNRPQYRALTPKFSWQLPWGIFTEQGTLSARRLKIGPIVNT